MSDAYEYYVLVLSLSPDAPNSGGASWALSYSLIGSFPDRQTAIDYAATVPPQRDDGTPCFAQMKSAFHTGAAAGDYFVVVAVTGEGLPPTLFHSLYGPYQDEQAATDAAGSYRAGLVIKAVAPD